MNRHSWENMRPWHRRPEHGERPYDRNRQREQDARDAAQRDVSRDDYYGYESHDRQRYEEFAPRHEGYMPQSESLGRYGAGNGRQDDQRWRQPLYPELSDQDSEGYQYFGGGRQNYAGVESGGGSLAMDHYLPQASSAAFYDWDRSLWGGREAGAVGMDYYGVGPRGYERSDERIHEDICERLSEDPFIDPSEVSVSVQSGKVLLEGSIEDRPQKYRVEDIVDACRGVKEVQNRLTISQRPSEAELGDWSDDRAPRH